MKNLNSTPEEKIAECIKVIEDCNNSMVIINKNISDNNLQIQSFRDSITSINTRITSLETDNVNFANSINTLRNRIIIENEIISDYTPPVKK